MDNPMHFYTHNFYFYECPCLFALSSRKSCKNFIFQGLRSFEVFCLAVLVFLVKFLLVTGTNKLLQFTPYFALKLLSVLIK